MTRRPLILAAIALAATFAAARAGDDDAARKGAAVELGRRLFFDPTASRGGRIACAACHDPDHGFSGTQPNSTDEDGSETPRHTPSLVDLGDGPLGWDGKFDTLREAVEDRILDPSKLRDVAAERIARRYESAKAAGAATDDPLFFDAAIRILSGGDASAAARGRPRSATVGADGAPIPSRLAGRYAAAFRAAFGDDAVTGDRVVDALAAYVKSLKSGESPYDRFHAGKADAIPEPARRGFDLFVGKAKCATCHVVSTGTSPSTFTDGAFHATYVDKSVGRAATDFVAADRGAFRTPSLSDVARRGPYFHDGSAATLEDVVRFYDIGAGGKPLGLTDQETADLVAFLRSLTGDVAPGAAEPTPRITVLVHVERLSGVPDAWVRIRVTPFGQPLGDAPATATEVSADENGDARFAFPASTHVVLDASDETLGLSRPIPDSTTSVRLTATPRGAVSFHVRRPKSPRPAPKSIELRTMARAPAFGGTEFPGRVCPDASDTTLWATLVRDLRDDEALYSMPAPGLDGVLRRWIFAEADYGPFDVDLSGGASNVLDLTRPTPSDARPTEEPSPAMRRLKELLLATLPAKRK